MAKRERAAVRTGDCRLDECRCALRALYRALEAGAGKNDCQPGVPVPRNAGANFISTDWRCAIPAPSQSQEGGRQVGWEGLPLKGVAPDGTDLTGGKPWKRVSHKPVRSWLRRILCQTITAEGEKNVKFCKPA